MWNVAFACICYSFVVLAVVVEKVNILKPCWTVRLLFMWLTSCESIFCQWFCLADFQTCHIAESAFIVFFSRYCINTCMIALNYVKYVLTDDVWLVYRIDNEKHYQCFVVHVVELLYFLIQAANCDERMALGEYTVGLKFMFVTKSDVSCFHFACMNL